MPCHRRDGTAGTQELIYWCYSLQASPLSVTTTGRAEQPKDGPRRRHRRHPRDPKESAVGRMEQLADVGRSDPALRRDADSELNDLTGAGRRISPTHETLGYLGSVDDARAG